MRRLQVLLFTVSESFTSGELYPKWFKHLKRTKRLFVFSREAHQSAVFLTQYQSAVFLTQQTDISNQQECTDCRSSGEKVQLHPLIWRLEFTFTFSCCYSRRLFSKSFSNIHFQCLSNKSRITWHTNKWISERCHPEILPRTERKSQNVWELMRRSTWGVVLVLKLLKTPIGKANQMLIIPRRNPACQLKVSN